MGFLGKEYDGSPNFKDRAGNRVWLPRLLVGVLYDPRIKFGGTPSEISLVLKVIAKEIESADSFENWLAHRNNLKVR